MLFRSSFKYTCVPDELGFYMSNYKSVAGVDTYNDYNVNYQIFGKSLKSNYGYWNCISNVDNAIPYFNYIIFISKTTINMNVCITPLFN